MLLDFLYALCIDINLIFFQVALLQSRMAKRKKKQRRIRTVEEDDERPAKKQDKHKSKKKQTNFASDLTDTSRSATKRLRYDANRVQKGKPLQDKGKFKGKGKSKGKSFGKPQAPKQNARRKNK